MIALFLYAERNGLFLYYKVKRLNFISEQLCMAARNNFRLFYVTVLCIY
jgi:hypothetical protein